MIFVGDFFNATSRFEYRDCRFICESRAAAAMLPLLAVFSYIQFHRSQMLEHARALSVIATSQVMGRKNDLIEGREIFLLYGRAEHLLQRMARSFGVYIQASALTVQIDIWASFWIRLFSEGFSFIVLLLMTRALLRGEINPALAGVIISSLFGITGSMGWLDFASSMVSRSTPHVRRVFEFVDLPPEETEEGRPVPPVRISVHVPATGEIEFVNYTMSYRVDTPVILNRLNLKIPLGSKTALIGRTGSGKTSLIQALLRMVYVHEGDIRIGGRSVFDVDVTELRRIFGVVPQSPYLFAGTIRSNLDRIGTSTLRRCRLQFAL